MNKIIKKLSQFARAIKASFSSFTKHDTATLGAALSYYTVFSIAPIIIIVLPIVGAIFGHNTVENELQRQLKALFGNQSAAFWQDIVMAAYKPGKNILIAILASIMLVAAASSVFSQLRTSLNIIWNVKEVAKKPALKFITDRLFSFAGIACMAFLLLVSLVIHTALEALANYLNKYSFHFSVQALIIIDSGISFFITIFLLALVYKFMSDAKIKWKDVWWGSIFTALLFSLGKYIIAEVLAKTNISSEYGAAGSVVVVLIWVFYSSQIIFFGAEFTRAWATENGISLDPAGIKKEDAVKTNN